MRDKERSIYEFPELLHVIQIEEPGEVAAEVDFLRRVWRRHSRHPVRRVLEVACGSSPHGQILAAGGIAVTGIDRSARMMAQAHRESPGLDRLTFFRRRIERFTLPVSDFDAAFFMSETLPVLVDNTDLLSHLQSVGAVLRKGALYTIDIDRHDGLEAAEGKRMLWRTRRAVSGAVSVAIREYLRGMPWHEGAWIYELECTISFPGREVRTRDLIPVRYTLPKLLDLAARACGVFKLIAVYSDMSFDTALDRCDRRWWGVLRRI